jgi:UDP-glucose 4-epimerase
LMLQGRQPVIYGDGLQIRCFSYVDDCLSCLKAMACRQNVLGQVINIGPDEGAVTIVDLARRIARLLHFHLEPVYLPGPPNAIRFAACSSDKARLMLGYRTTTDLDTGLSRMIQHIKDRGPRPFQYHLPLEISNHLTPKTWTERLF